MRLAEPVRLAEGQVAASGAVLARAFTDDPFFTYVLSDPVERERLMPPLMEAWTRYGLLFGEVYVTAGPVEASAIWLAPGAQTEERREQAGLTAVVSAFSVGARARYDAIVQHQGRIREAVPSVPHWHLPFIGVDPARQGLGLGSLLLRAGFLRVDQDRVECRLFTDEPRNVPLYQRHGFEIAAEGDVPGGPHFRYMRRRPHPLRRDRPPDGSLPGVRRPLRRETPSSTLSDRAFLGEAVMNVNSVSAQVESLYGTWRLLSIVRELVATGERVDIFGKAPQGFITYGRDGRMSAIVVGNNRPRPPDLAKLTDQERAELFKTMVAYAGTFKVEGTRVLHSVDISWNENWTGSVQVRSFRFEGRRLIITDGPQIGPDGREVIAVLTWEKVD